MAKNERKLQNTLSNGFKTEESPRQQRISNKRCMKNIILMDKAKRIGGVRLLDLFFETTQAREKHILLNINTADMSIDGWVNQTHI